MSGVHHAVSQQASRCRKRCSRTRLDETDARFTLRARFGEPTEREVCLTESGRRSSEAPGPGPESVRGQAERADTVGRRPVTVRGNISGGYEPVRAHRVRRRSEPTLTARAIPARRGYAHSVAAARARPMGRVVSPIRQTLRCCFGTLGDGYEPVGACRQTAANRAALRPRALSDRPQSFDGRGRSGSAPTKAQRPAIGGGPARRRDSGRLRHARRGNAEMRQHDLDY